MITEIKNFRNKYPDYADMDDITLAKNLASKYPDAYGDLPSKILQEQSMQGITTSKVRPVTKQVSVEPIQQTLENIPKGLEMAQQKTSEMLSNVPESTINLIKNTVTPLLHPIQTAKGILNLATLDNSTWANLANFFKERYGGFKELENTIIKDPVGFATDVSGALSAVGGVTKLATKGLSTIAPVSTTSILQKTGQTLSEFGKATDPFRAIGKTLTLAGQKASDITANILGMTTGTGKVAIKRAFEGGEEFTKGLRGKIDAQTVLDNALGALEEVKQQRRTAYQTQLAEIGKSKVIIDKVPIMNQLNKSLKSFNIKTYLDDTGEFVVDMSKSALDRSVRGAMTDLITDVFNWNDWSPIGADILKKRIDDFYAPTKNSRAFVAPLRNAVKGTIVKDVPEYYKMTKDYEVMSNHINDITKNLLSGKTDTVLRRLNIIFRDINEYRQSLLQKLDTLTNGNLSEPLAGVTLHAGMPRGWPSKVVPTLSAGGLAFYNPLLAAGVLGSSSPRLMGEMVLKAGQASRVLQKGTKPLMPWWKYIYQTGRIDNLQEE